MPSPWIWWISPTGWERSTLFDIGWDDYLERGGVCAVEWSENVADAIPPDAVRVAIERAPGGDDCRRITITGGEPI